MNIFEERRKKLMEAMQACGVDAALFAPSSDFLYLTGSSRKPAQRVTALIIGPERSAVFMPGFEISSDGGLDPALERIPYSDSDDTAGLLAGLLPASGCIAAGAAVNAGLLLPLQSILPNVSWRCADGFIAPLRIRKSEQEIRCIETAQHMAERALSRLLQEPLVGRTEREIASRLAELQLEEGFDAVGPGIIASGPNTANPHHVNGDRTVSEGDALMFDIGGTYRGYHADFTRTYAVGHAPDGFREIYEIVLAAHFAGKEAATAGMPAAEADRAARQVIESAGYGPFFTHRLGHGIGLDVHEAPFITSQSQTPLENGSVFSCEPGIYLPGRFGIRIEDLLVMENGHARSLNDLTKDLQIIPV